MISSSISLQCPDGAVSFVNDDVPMLIIIFLLAALCWLVLTDGESTGES
jgi:hypothetical protein